MIVFVGATITDLSAKKYLIACLLFADAIVTFDPPLNGLDSLTFSLYDRYGNPEDSLRNIKYEFIIETVSKIRNY